MWNKRLDEIVHAFSREYANADVHCSQYSSFQFLTEVLDDPTEYGFDAGDARKYGGGIWADHIHLTGAVHKLLAESIHQYLTLI